MIRKQVLDFEPYSAGLSIEEIRERFHLATVIKLASNENPLGCSPKVNEALEEHSNVVHRYPRAGSPKLRKALGDYWGISSECVVAGNGSDEIIDLLIRIVAEPNRSNIVAFQPCFSIYQLQANLCGVEFRQVPLRKDFSFPFNELLNKVDSSTAIVFLTTPDNPSGFTPPVDELINFHRRLPKDCLFVVDEAYMDFAQPQEQYSMIHLAGKLSNLVILRTFSKLYGLAGLRLGYGVMPKLLAEYMLRVKLPFSVNLLAEEAGIAALKDNDFRDSTLNTVIQGRVQLTRSLTDLGFEVYPSQANFLLVKPAVDAETLFNRLLEQGIIIRRLASYGLRDHLRISIGNDEENLTLLAAIKDILAQ